MSNGILRSCQLSRKLGACHFSDIETEILLEDGPYPIRARRMKDLQIVRKRISEKLCQVRLAIRTIRDFFYSFDQPIFEVSFQRSQRHD